MMTDKEIGNLFDQIVRDSRKEARIKRLKKELVINGEWILLDDSVKLVVREK